MNGGRDSDRFVISAADFPLGLNSFVLSDTIVDFDQSALFGSLSQFEDDVLDLTALAGLTSAGVLNSSNLRVRELQNQQRSVTCLSCSDPESGRHLGDGCPTERCHGRARHSGRGQSIFAVNTDNYDGPSGIGASFLTIDPVTPQMTEGDTTITFTITRKGENLDEQDV